MTNTILVVDDDPAVLRGIQVLLEQANYTVLVATTGTQAIAIINTESLPSLIVLDILLPEHDGFEVCALLRRLPTHIPVLMLSARDEVTDKILGLEAGADDYLTKPFEPRELLARIRALLRFKQSIIGKVDEEQPLVYGNVTMWLDAHRVEVNGHPLILAPKEWLLFSIMLHHPNHVFGRETLLRQVWGYDFIGDSRTVDVHIQRLRAKLEEHGAGALIQTLRGFGYRLSSTSSVVTQHS